MTRTTAKKHAKPMGMKFSRMGGSKKSSRAIRIVPAKLVPLKAKQKRQLVTGPGTGCDLPLPTNDGFVVTYDGNYLIMGPPPAGGPWMPAMYANGQTVWINSNQ